MQLASYKFYQSVSLLLHETMSKRSHEALICDSHLSLLDADVKGCVLWSVNLTILDIYGTLSQPQHEDGLHSSAVCKSKTADMSKIQI